jgi:flagellar assembly factor FliW
MQSIQEPAFAMPVMDPLIVRPDYNPEVDDELLKPLGELQPDELLVMVTVTVPSDLKKMSVNLRGPIVINAAERKACQIIVEGEDYAVKFPIYDILNAKKAGE